MRWLGKLERLLLILGLLLIAVYLAARLHSVVLSRAEIRRFKEQSLLQQQVKALGTASQAPDFALWSPKRIKEYQASLASHLPEAIAVLRVPKIDLEVPVLEGTDDLTLNMGAGLIAGTARPDGDGNIGIAGHRDGFFRRLKDVALGDKIEIATSAGSRTYLIDKIVIVDPSDVSVLSPRSRPSVTLVTCYPFYFVGSAPKRYIVEASATN